MEEVESFPSRKNSLEWAMDLTRSIDTFQTSFIESRPALAEIDRSGGVLTRRDPITTDRSPEKREPISKVISDQTTNELTTSVAWSTIVNPGPDTLCTTTKPDIACQSSWPLSRSDVPHVFGPTVTSPSETKIPFIGHPLTYLFSQPTQQLSTQQRLKILLPTSPPVVSAVHSDRPSATKTPGHSEPGPNSVLEKSPGIADDAKFDGLAKLARSDLRKFVVEKVIEAAYSKEQELQPSAQSFPKTKKQLAVDKMSSSNKPTTPTQNRNGNLEPWGVANNAVSLLPVLGSTEGAENPERTRRSERNGDMAAMTIAEINEKLIMKVVQEEDSTIASVLDSPVSESRLPLKLQKKYKKLDGARHSGSSSGSFGSSSPDRSCSSVLDLETSSGLPMPTSDNQLPPQFSGSAEKSGFPAAGAQKVNIFMNANLLAAYPEFLRSGSLLAGERRQIGLTTAGASTGEKSTLVFC